MCHPPKARRRVRTITSLYYIRVNYQFKITNNQLPTLERGQSVSALSGLSNSFGINALTGAGSYTLSVAGTLTNPNYRVTSANTGTWAVNPASITVTALGGSSTYGSSPSNPGLSAIGLQNGQSAAVLTGLSNSFGITNLTNAGSYTLSVAGMLANPNYTVSSANAGTWAVNPATLLYVATPASTTAGDPIPTLTGTVSASSMARRSLRRPPERRFTPRPQRRTRWRGTMPSPAADLPPTMATTSSRRRQVMRPH